MAKPIYPHCGRIDNFSFIYCEMAMEAYYHASKMVDEIKKKNYFAIEGAIEWDALGKDVIKTVVFSAMTIEAFFNNYAAACLGDSEFYGSFDQLSPISKFELIAKFILEAQIDKSKSYYSQLKKLIARRNLYIHNKSRAVTFGYATLEEALEVQRRVQQLMDQGPKIDKQRLKSELNEALDALKAVRDIARFFDQHDTNVYAIKQLFRLHSMNNADPYEQYKRFTHKALQIKMEE